MCRKITENELKEYLNNQKQYGLFAANILGKCIIDRAKWCEETGRKPPFLIADIKTLPFHVQLAYTGRIGELMSFSLFDLHSPEGGVHGYPKSYMGDTEAFFMEIIRELEYIAEIHSIKR